MGNKISVRKVNFEDIQNILTGKPNNVLLINTLDNNKEAQAYSSQNCPYNEGTH